MTAITVHYPAGSRSLEAGTTLRIGRDERADLRLNHPDVSRRHLVIYYADGWCIADEGSSNGTWVEGTRISAMRVEGPVTIGVGAAAGAIRIDLVPAPAVAPIAAPATVIGGAVRAGAPGLDETVLAAGAPQPFRAFAPADLAPGAAGAIHLGKAPENDLVVDDIHASRRHARATPMPGGFLVEDLGSLNGTFVNAAPIQRAFLGEGDVLTIGNTDFVRAGDRLVFARDHMTGGGLEVDGLGFEIRGGKKLIADVAFSARRGTLTAVIGPSGAGKSTLSRLLAGVTDPTSGSVRFDGFDLVRDYQAVKTRVGLVPQEDVVHRQLSARRALGYAASLRLSSGLSRQSKRAQVTKAADQLGLQNNMETRIERLSGGQRKRASVAMELLTEPSLLILDEPTSGLDPALDRQVMRTLRELADGERTVLVITHSVAYLDVCDHVLVLAPGGHVAYFGAPDGIGSHFGTDDWGDIFGALAADPLAARQRWEAVRRPHQGRVASPSADARGGVRRESSWWRQLLTLAARQVNLMVADRGYIAFLAALPFLIGLMPFVVPGSAGLTAVPPGEPSHAGEPTSVLSLLVIGATFMGISMSIRDLVGERAIYLRERAVGLLPSAYLTSKLIVFGLFAGVSAGIMVAVSTAVKPAPESGVMGFGPPLFELWMPLALTTWVAAILGLLLSSLVTSNDQVMPVLIVVLMVQLVLHGGLIPILDNDVLNAVSKAVPGRWGFAAAASGIDLEGLTAPGQPPGADVGHDPLWESQRWRWALDTTVLALFGAVFATLTWLRLRAGRR